MKEFPPFHQSYPKLTAELQEAYKRRDRKKILQITAIINDIMLTREILKNQK